MRKIEQYSVQEGVTPLSGPELSERFLDIDGRLHLLEELKVSWQQAVVEVQNHGLERINGVVEPVLDQANDILGQIQQEFASVQQEWDQTSQAIDQEWQNILDGWAGVQGTLDNMSADIATLQSDVANLQSDLSAHLALPSDKLAFGQQGLVSVHSDLANIPGGPRTLSKVKIMVTIPPSGGPCSITFKRNGADDIIVGGSLDIADGAYYAVTTNLQNNTLGEFDWIQMGATAGNNAQNLMVEME